MENNYLEQLSKGQIKLKDIPVEHRTPELCEAAVKLSGIALHSVPIELLTKELCEMAVKKDGMAL